MPDNERIKRNVAKMRAQGATDAEVEHYLSKVEGLKPKGAASTGNIDLRTMQPSVADVPPNMRVKAAATSVTPGEGDMHALASGVRGMLAAAPQAIPGMERVQAGLRSIVRQQPYQEALADMRTETDPVP